MTATEMVQRLDHLESLPARGTVRSNCRPLCLFAFFAFGVLQYTHSDLRNEKPPSLIYRTKLLAKSEATEAESGERGITCGDRREGPQNK